MAHIEKIEGKRGTTYRFIVSGGFDTNGKRITRKKTWRPPEGMTARQIEKAVQRAAVDFERSIEQGFVADDRQTFSQYAQYVLDLKERDGTKAKTLDRYKELLVRINQAIGHMKLADIRPQHLNTFYKNLAEPGIRAGGGSATAKIDIAAWLKANKRAVQVYQQPPGWRLPLSVLPSAVNRYRRQRQRQSRRLWGRNWVKYSQWSRTWSHCQIGRYLPITALSPSYFPRQNAKC